jgi:hypothetical protein
MCFGDRLLRIPEKVRDHFGIEQARTAAEYHVLTLLASASCQDDCMLPWSALTSLHARCKQLLATASRSP